MRLSRFIAISALRLSACLCPARRVVASLATFLIAGELRTEVKVRANGEGFATIERWLGDNDLLFMRRDRAEPLVVMPWGFYKRLIVALMQCDAQSPITQATGRATPRAYSGSATNTVP